MTDDTLLLRLRAETLKANLTRLTRTVDPGQPQNKLLTPDRMADLNTLEMAATDLRQDIAAADKARNELRDRIYSNEPITWQDETASGALESMYTSLRQGQLKLLTMLNEIGQRKNLCFLVEKTPVGQEIVDDLRQRASPLKTTLDNIQTQASGGKNLTATWETLLKKAGPETEPIFAEYMELLGAAALRDAGFDEKISYFFDELLKSTGGKLLALPMRRQALMTTFKRIIRVTFPDWTLWALPSSALEFWNVIERDQMEKPLSVKLDALSTEDQAAIRQEHRQCLGDAYATYTMGPAYAYYAVGLVLAPDSEQEQCKVRAILAMLDSMQGMTGCYGEVRRKLLTAWNGARAQLKQPILNIDLDGGQDADQTDPDGKGVRVLIRSFFKVLEQATFAKFSAAIWTETEKWVEPLLGGNANQISLPVGVEWRHLLNAAWRARVHSGQPSSDLTKTVTELQELIKKRQEKKK